MAQFEVTLTMGVVEDIKNVWDLNEKYFGAETMT